MKKVLEEGNVPSAVGPYSLAVRHGDLVLLSGQVAIDRKTNEPVYGPVAEQTRIALENIREILRANGLTMDNILKCDVYMTSLDDVEEMNTVYGTFFKDNPPARITVAVTALYKGLSIEIDAIAAL